MLNFAKTFRIGSVCSGIGAPERAWHDLGWNHAFVSEIEAFPRAVLAHRFPHVPLHGDFTTIGADTYGPVDLLVGGTPCQSFSVAGLRRGLADERGNLALEYLRLADRLGARWLVWENVPGVLSSSGGRDFGAFLGGLAELGYGFAYRVLDAQHFGVAQRRRRFFVVGYLGDWRRAAAVLFEPASLRGHPASRREAGERTADCLTVGANQYSGFAGEPVEIARCVTTGEGRRQDAESCTLLPVAHTLRASGFDASEDGTGRGTPLVPVAFAQNQRDEVREMQVVGALAAEPGMKQQTYLKTGSAVRRLTPRECERLQGFPDDWTLIPHRGREAADGPRYKALGNSMAVPVMAWIGRRLARVESQLEVGVAA